MKRTSLMLAAAALLVTASPGKAQESRADLVEQARNEFDQAAALDLLMRAADPTAATPDSLWSVGVFDLAQRLSGMDEADQAALWLRFAAREGPGMGIDRSWYPESLVEAYDREALTVSRSVDRSFGATGTTWEWPADFDADAPGRLAVEAPGGLDVQVAVEGRGSVPVGGAAELPPGSYVVEATAPDREAVRTTRDVLPGVTTVLTIEDLPPVLPAGVGSSAESGLVSIRTGSGVCVDGVVRENGLILTALSALPRTIGLEVVTQGGATHRDLAVVERDAGRDLAVLRVEGEAGTPLPAAGAPTGGAWAWAVYRPGCGQPATATTRLSDDPADLAAAVDAEAVGGPVVDVSGALLGIVVGPSQVAPLTGAQNLLAQALGAPAGGTPVSPQVESGGGGFPLKWVAAGVGVVGVAALVAGGGGGDDDDNGNGNGNGGRTGIRITLPSGGTP